MQARRDPVGRPPADILAEWRRLERVLSALLEDEEQLWILRRIEELRAEYQAATSSRANSVSDPTGA